MAYVDHIVIAVDDLPAAAARWQTATGVAFVAGGQHPKGTRNCLGVLAGQELYLELVTVHDASFQDDWTRAVAGRRGALSWAIGTHDIEGDRSRLEECGVPMSPVRAGSRTCPDGRVVTWQTASYGAPDTSPWPFLIQWPATGAARLGVPPGQADQKVTLVTIAVPDPARAVDVMTTALGFSPGPGTCVTDGVVEVEFTPSGSEPARPVALEFHRLASAVTLDGVQLR